MKVRTMGIVYVIVMLLAFLFMSVAVVSLIKLIYNHPREIGNYIGEIKKGVSEIK